MSAEDAAQRHEIDGLGTTRQREALTAWIDDETLRWRNVVAGLVEAALQSRRRTPLDLDRPWR